MIKKNRQNLQVSLIYWQIKNTTMLPPLSEFLFGDSDFSPVSSNRYYCFIKCRYSTYKIKFLFKICRYEFQYMCEVISDDFIFRILLPWVFRWQRINNIFLPWMQTKIAIAVSFRADRWNLYLEIGRQISCYIKKSVPWYKFRISKKELITFIK